MSYHRGFRKAQFGLMNCLCAFALAFALILGQGPTAAHASTQIVRVASPGLTVITCGGTWATACDLQFALGIVAPGPGDRYDFWLKGHSTYFPTTDTDRSKTFTLKSQVRLLGGFAGDETTEFQRDPYAQLTYLSGNIGDDASRLDNSYHVVTASFTDNDAVLDGVIIWQGQADAWGLDANGGGMTSVGGSPTLNNVRFENNYARYGGGMSNISGGNPVLSDVTFAYNQAVDGGGGMFNDASSPTLTRVTFEDNLANMGGGIHDATGSRPTLLNVTMFDNSTTNDGGGIYSQDGTLGLTNVTFSGNSASIGAGGISALDTALTINDSIFWDVGIEITRSAGVVILNDNLLLGGCPSGASCTHVLSTDPGLGSLADRGALTQTQSLRPGSDAIDSGNNSTCAATDQRGWLRPVDGDRDGTATCDMGAYEYALSPLEVDLAGASMGTYYIRETLSDRPSLPGANNGAVKVWSIDGANIVASERVLYAGTSYSEMMGYPGNQLTDEFWFPWYNNVAMNSQLRVSNLGASSTTISVYMGPTFLLDSFTLAAGAASRKNYAGINSGPIHVVSSGGVPILATIRVIYGANSYSEMMGYPGHHLTDEFWFPWYNNSAMDTQLRVGNLGLSGTTITVYLGDGQIDSFLLDVGAAIRKSYAGLNGGPLQVVSSSSDILATLRVVFAGGSYSEMMGYPGDQLTNEFWFPAYDDQTADSQLRVSNLGSDYAGIWVYGADGAYLWNDTLAPEEARRISIVDYNGGPIRIVTREPAAILATIRTVYGGSSYYETPGIPIEQVTDTYWFPWYNNTAMSTELHLAVP